MMDSYLRRNCPRCCGLMGVVVQRPVHHCKLLMVGALGAAIGWRGLVCRQWNSATRDYIEVSRRGVDAKSCVRWLSATAALAKLHTTLKPCDKHKQVAQFIFTT